MKVTLSQDLLGTRRAFFEGRLVPPALPAETFRMKFRRLVETIVCGNPLHH
jgi:hypothetical protein